MKFHLDNLLVNLGLCFSTAIIASPIAQAISLAPTVATNIQTTASLEPTVVGTYPGANERVLSSVAAVHYDPLPRVTILFSEPIVAQTSAQNAVVITNVRDGTITARNNYTASILSNALYIESTRWDADTEYNITVDGSQIKSSKNGNTMRNNFSWNFQTHKTYYPHLPSHDESEPIPEFLLKKNALNPAVQILNNTDSVTTYRVTITPYGVTSLRNITIKDVLPPGFSFDSIVGGNVNNGTTVQAQGNSQITFTVNGEIRGGTAFYFDYRAKINGQQHNGTPIVPAGTYHNLVLVKGYFTPVADVVAAYGNNNFHSEATDSREDSDNVIITRKTTILPTPNVLAPSPSLSAFPTTLPLPTVTSVATKTSTNRVGLEPPSSDPLTCLNVGTANTLTFHDLESNDPQAPYIHLLNSTVFVGNPNTRLVKGYDNGNFGSNNTLTRFELTKIALGTNCIDYLNQITPNDHFSDVPTDHSELSIIIGKAYAKGIIQGIGNRFYPDRPVTYGEMMKILIGAGIYFDHGSPKQVLNKGLNGITDESFRQFAEYAAQMNLLSLTNNIFPQNETVSRRFMAQAAARYIMWIKKLPTI